jgi:hypothetical protein
VRAQGEKFVILDCGGGTVDVTVHSLVTKTPFRLNELAPPSGGPWGSTYVDAAFCDVLRDMTGAASYERLTKCMAYLDLMVRLRRGWECRMHFAVALPAHSR